MSNKIHGVYYHLSKEPNLSTLTPKIPSKLVNHTANLEDLTIPRVSFAPTLGSCIWGLQFLDSDFTGNKPITLYVYMNVGSFKGITNRDIIKNKYIFDAELTKELWSTSEVTVKPVGIVKVFKEVVNTQRYMPILPDKFTDKDMLLPDGSLIAYYRKFTFKSL